MRLWIFLLCVSLSFPAVAEEMGPSFDELNKSVEQLEKDWNQNKRDYKKRFKETMSQIEQKIKSLESELDGGDPRKRQEINSQLTRMKTLRDWVRENFHEITAMSIVNIGSKQKHFINAKDDRK